MSAPDKADRLDGRVERTLATRRRILDVTRDLLVQGAAQPTAREIADAASITTRTLFRHFNDMDSLFERFVEDVESQVMAVRDEAFPEGGRSMAAKERIETIIDRRCRVYETLLPLYVSRIWTSYRTSSRQHRRQWAIRGRQRLQQVLGDSLISDDLLFEAVDATLSLEYWVTLRRDQRLSASRARLVVERAMQQFKLVEGHVHE